MPAVSKAQQKFFGMVRATQKGEMETPSSEVAKAAASMSKSDVKKFAKTKHKGLPEKKKVDETTYYRQDSKYQKKLSDQSRANKEKDARMKYGKNFKQFAKDAESAKNRLRPGEVKRWDKEKGRYVSNKE